MRKVGGVGSAAGSGEFLVSIYFYLCELNEPAKQEKQMKYK